MMEGVLVHKPTVGKSFVANQNPNGFEVQIDNKHTDTELLAVGGLFTDPIMTIGGTVSIKSALLQVDRPYGFILGGVPLVIVKRKDGSADVYTTPTPSS